MAKKKTVELLGQRAQYERAIEIYNGNLVAVEAVIKSIPEIGSLTLELIEKFDKGTSLQDLFAEIAEDYIASMTPMPLESIKGIIRSDYMARVPRDRDTIETLNLFTSLQSWFESQTGEAVELVQVGGCWHVDPSQVKRLIASCTVTLSENQSIFVDLLNAIHEARVALRNFEISHGINPAVGEAYLRNPETLYGLLQAVK